MLVILFSFPRVCFVIFPQSTAYLITNHLLRTDATGTVKSVDAAASYLCLSGCALCSGLFGGLFGAARVFSIRMVIVYLSSLNDPG